MPNIAKLGQKPLVTKKPLSPDELRTNRPTPELVVGMVGAVGSGVSTSAESLKKILEEKYGYKVTIYKVSDIILESYLKQKDGRTSPKDADRIKKLQAEGTRLRDSYGDSYLVEKIVEKIGTKRLDDHEYTKEGEGVLVANPVRNATIIDSLKHPEESKLLNEVYGGIYWQYTVLAPEKIRETRLKKIGVEKKDISSIFSKDEDEGEDHGQSVTDTAHLSDFFIRNDGQNKKSIERPIKRFLEILFGVGIHTPTFEEAGMYSAVAAAGKSACLSRQVGAAIYSPNNELVSVGWNDVPKFTGGLYTEDDGENDHRCHKWGDCICHNEIRKEALYQKIFGLLEEEGLLSEGAEFSDTGKGSTKKLGVKSVLKRTPLKQLIEYSRSVHAEMEAIVSAARSGKDGLVGGTLYTTTFPCHNCARHIVAAGITKVVYIEPYSKSLAFELHGDAIQNSNTGDGLPFLQFEGVGPASMMRLFSSGQERKNDGKIIEHNNKTVVPIVSTPLDGYPTHEKRVMRILEERESNK